MIWNILIAYLLTGVVIATTAWFVAGRHMGKRPVHPLLTMTMLAVIWFPLIIYALWSESRGRTSVTPNKLSGNPTGKDLPCRNQTATT